MTPRLPMAMQDHDQQTVTHALGQGACKSDPFAVPSVGHAGTRTSTVCTTSRSLTRAHDRGKQQAKGYVDMGHDQVSLYASHVPAQVHRRCYYYAASLDGHDQSISLCLSRFVLLWSIARCMFRMPLGSGTHDRSHKGIQAASWMV